MVDDKIEKILEMRKQFIVEANQENNKKYKFAAKCRVVTLGKVLDILGYKEPELQKLFEDLVHEEHPTYESIIQCMQCCHWKKDVPGCTDNVGRCEYAGWMVGRNGYCVYGEK